MNSRPARWKTAFLLVTSSVSLLALGTFFTGAAGCADDASPAPEADEPDATADSNALSPDSADATVMKLDCATDLEADGIWKHLECSGLYASFADKTIAADVKAYKPAVEFWSDGAEKQRWVFLPPGTKIDITDWNEWKYPQGTKLWKEFKLGGKRIETRIFTKLPDNTWGHTTYRWNADETDAVRKDGGETVSGVGPDGGPYEIPSAGQCEQCHIGRKDLVLGFDAVNLGLPTATGQTLSVLAAEGWLSQTPPSTALVMPGSDAAKAAVGWVNANCGACHNANSNAAATFRKHFLVRASDLASPDGGAATLEELDVWKQGYCVDSIRSEPDAGKPFKYIRGGSPERSIMSILAHSRSAPDVLPNAGVQMPPIVSRAVDYQGVKLLDDWIAGLPPCP